GDDVWYGTMNGGVICYNKTDSTWKIFTTIDGLPSNDVRSVFIEEDGTVWIGTKDGVAIFDGTDWKILNILYDHHDPNQIYAIYKDSKGLMWFGLVGAIATFDGNDIEIFFIDGRCTQIFEDSLHTMWFNIEKALLSFNGVEWKTHMEKPPYFMYVFSAVIDKNDVIWIESFLRILSFDTT
ncbi:unnamed protein product, partial [marine sediment metagenome]